MAAARGVYVSHLIPGLQEAGFSATGALEYLKGNTDRLSAADQAAAAAYTGPAEPGVGGMRRQNFLRTWGAMQRDESMRERVSTGDPYGVPHATEVTYVSRPRARGREYVVNVPVYDTQDKGFHFRPISVVTDEALTRLEIVERGSQTLRDILAGAPENYPTQQVFGFGSIAHAFERVPEIDEPLE